MSTIGTRRTDVVVVYVEANLTGTTTEAMRRTAAEGMYNVLLISDPDFYAAYPDSPLEHAHTVEVLDTFDVDLLVSKAKHYSASALIAFDDYHLLPAAQAARQLGLTGPHPPSIAMARNKFSIRSALAGRNDSVPFETVDVARDTNLPIGAPNYPFVAKPLDESGSVSVRLISSAQEWEIHVAQHYDRSANARGFTSSDLLLLEEFIEGDEFSAEVFQDATGVWHVAAITTKYVSAPPAFVELAHVSGLKSQLDVVIVRSVLEWLDDAEAQYPAAHVELRVDQTGTPRLVEINPRLPGGHIVDLVRLTTGVDLVQAYVNYHLPEGVSLGQLGHSTQDLHTVAAIIYSPNLEDPSNLRSLVQKFSAPTEPASSSMQTNFDRNGYVIISGERDSVLADMAEIMIGAKP